MCAGTILQSRIKKVVYGAKEPKFGALGSILDISNIPEFNHQLEIVSGVMEDKTSEIMKLFFQNLRKK
mgnify:CR=1 FL=1